MGTGARERDPETVERQLRERERNRRDEEERNPVDKKGWEESRKKYEEITKKREEEEKQRRERRKKEEERQRRDREQHTDKYGPRKHFSGVQWSQQEDLSSPGTERYDPPHYNPPGHGYESKKQNANSFESVFKWGTGRPSLQKYKHNLASIQKRLAATAADIRTWEIDPKTIITKDGYEVVHSITARINPGL